MNKFKLTKIIASIIATAIIFITLLIILINLGNKTNNQSSISVIQNFNSYYQDVPAEVSNNIYSTLYQTIKLNSIDNPSTLNDIQIRTSTPYIYQYYHTNQQYYLNFIVDIPSIQQSYHISYKYSVDPSRPVGGYPFLISCLSSKNQIYPDYNCKDFNPDGLTEDYIQ